MARRIIQVPVEEDLLDALDKISQKQKKARADVIRQACRRYLQQAESEELDELYRRGYEKIPEEDWGEMQVALFGHVLPNECW